MVRYFSQYKLAQQCLLVFDGANSHLGANIITAADTHNGTLFCLPSNTTHKLQSVDKSVFRSFKHFWDEKFWVKVLDQKITK